MTTTNMEQTIDVDLWLDNLRRYLNHRYASSIDAVQMSTLEVSAFEQRIIQLEAPVTEQDIKAHADSGKLFVIVHDDGFPIEIYPLFELRPRGYNIHGYSHLDKEDQNKQISITIPDVAVQLMNINYGQQRMLANIVKIRERSPSYFRFFEYQKHTDELRELLEKGWY